MVDNSSSDTRICIGRTVNRHLAKLKENKKKMTETMANQQEYFLPKSSR